MSLILDALKRAERERQAEPLPTRTPDVVAMPGRAAVAPGGNRRLVGAVITVAGLALAALLLWDAFRAPAPPAPVATAPPPAETPAQAPPPAIKARPAPPTAAVPGTEAVTSLDDLTDESSLDAPAAPASAPAKKQKPVPSTAIATRPAPPPATSTPQAIGTPAPAAQATQPAPKAQAPAAATPQAQPPAPAPAPSPASPAPSVAAPAMSPPATTEAAPPAEIPPALTQPAPLRKFREMPPDYRADFPALRVEIHVFEQERQRRFVIVNGRKYREGERMAEGPTLVEIVAEGMVLEYRGEKVLYTLGR